MTVVSLGSRSREARIYMLKRRGISVLRSGANWVILAVILRMLPMVIRIARLARVMSLDVITGLHPSWAIQNWHSWLYSGVGVKRQCGELAMGQQDGVRPRLTMAHASC